MVMLAPLLNKRSDIFVRNRFLLYKQLNCPMMDYGPAYCFAA
jgi:hypothetical protein